jgi:uncharacterized DUF497 family protein
MGIIWDKSKGELLLETRGLSFEIFAEKIMSAEYIAKLENPTREGQDIFLVRHKGYVHVVPFVLDAQGNIVLKTIYPSRKAQKQYGGDSHGKD